MTYHLSQPLGNNAFSYDQRKALWSDCFLVISDIMEVSSLDQVQLGDFVVFEEIDHLGKLHSHSWFAQTYILPTSQSKIVITDNHNHVLPHWLELLSSPSPKYPNEYKIGKIIHIDQHSDLWPNSNQLDLSQIQDPQYTRDFAHLDCNIGNFITPCIDSWLITHMTQIRTEYALQAESKKELWLITYDLWPLIVDIDLDFRAPQMWISNIEHTMSQVRLLMDHADLITIATSPYFIDQTLALDLLHQLLWPYINKI